jgi:tRNA threonylcarbamoyl adenosine modification protein (Sua5/YciO/YrdC/YwlC family)
MAQLLAIHPKNPESRLIRRAVDVLLGGGVLAYPTDSAYALGCMIGNKAGLQKITRIRQLDTKHNFTLVCRDLSELATYARVDNSAYRLLKAFTPGPYTFILKATSEVPRLMMHPKRKTIGIRVPDHPVISAMLTMLDQPILSSTLILPGEEDPPYEIDEVLSSIGHAVDLVIDSGYCGPEVTTVVDLSEGAPQVLRQGKGDPQPFLD